MVKKIKVLISGAGPAGIAAALTLDPNLVEVTLIDRQPDFSSIGFSIILWQRGYDAFVKLVGRNRIHGLYPLNTFSVYGTDAMRKLESSDSTGAGYSIKRKNLIDTLANVLKEERPDVRLRFKTTILNIEESPTGVTVLFSDNSCEQFSYIILAEGMHSELAKTITPIKHTVENYKLYYAWLQGDSGLRDEAIVGYEKGCMYLLQTVGPDALLAYYSKEDIEANKSFESRLLAMLSRDFQGNCNINQNSKSEFALESKHAKSAHSGHVLLVGDCLHGNHPTLAMGTSLALEDGLDAGKTINRIARVGRSGSANPSALLQEYSKRRLRISNDIYGFQTKAQRMLLTTNKFKLAGSKVFITNGGWFFIDKKLRSMFTAKMNA